jgi:hypothetical protein
MYPFEAFAILDQERIESKQRNCSCIFETTTSLYIYTYLLTHGAEAFLRSCQLCSHSRTPQRFMEPEGSLRIHKSSPPVPILSHIDRIPTIPSYLTKIHINIVHPPTSWSSQWSLSFWISHQYYIYTTNFKNKSLDVSFLS